MIDDRRDEAFEPTVPRAVWRHRWLVLAAVVSGAVVGFLAVNMQSASWAATAGLVVEDPRASALFDPGAAQRPERYLENQVEILGLPVVADRAVEILARQTTTALDSEDLDEALSVRGDANSDFITVTFTAPDPDLAVIGANAVVDAYEELRRSETARTFESALAQLDLAITAGEEEIERIKAGIGGLAPDPGDIDEAIEVGLAELTKTMERVSALIARRDQLAVDSQVAAGGVIFSSPATEAEPAGLRASRAVPFGALAGGMIGAAVAFILAVRARSRFGDRNEPERVIGVPMIAEVPDFDDERVPGLLPVLEAPSSAAAEAFRFVTTVLNVPTANDRELVLDGTRSIAIISADPGDGRSVVAANVALAAAREGKRVAIVDADFERQRVVEMLAPTAAGGPGLTEGVLRGLDIHAVSATVSVGEDVIHVIGKGAMPVSASEFFHSPWTQQYFATLRANFDLLVIDTPPMLHVAYAGSLHRFADRAVVVVTHGSGLATLRDVADRCRVLGISMAGYVYNRSPLRRVATAGATDTGTRALVGSDH